MPSSQLFKWRHFQSDLILLNVRWYLRYGLSYRDLEEMMLERGVKVNHTTIYRWVQAYSPELDKRCRRYLKPTNDSWRVDETYCKIKGKWKYLYRAVDSQGNTLDFMLSAKRDAKAAKRFLRKVLNASHTIEPRVITVDKNAAYPPVIADLKADEALPETTEIRQSKYLNNTVEQDHRFLKRRIKPGLGFGSFNTARRTLKGYEAMNMIRKGQIKDTDRGNVMGQISFINEIFGVAA
ncbi:MAG: IS6 family transposase [Cyanobacteria bacterium P01_A01_bin.116]